MSINAISLTHIPLSPPTDCLSLPRFPPLFVLVISTPLLSSHPCFPAHLHLLPVNFSVCFFLRSSSFSIPLYDHPHIKTLFLCFSSSLLPSSSYTPWFHLADTLLCPLLCIHVTASWCKIFNTLWVMGNSLPCFSSLLFICLSL